MRSYIKLSSIVILLVIVLAGCGQKSNTDKNRDIILQNSFDNEDRNRLLIEDINYFKDNFPKKHKNPFSVMAKKDFEQHIDMLIADVNKLDNNKVFVRLCEIIASVQDAHSSVNIWDGYAYPLKFFVFDDELYIINADNSLADMLYAKVTKINNVDANEVISQVKNIIPHENESWAMYMLPQYISSPVYMYGLGIIPDEVKTVFTIEKKGTVSEITVPILGYGQIPDFCVQETNDVVAGIFSSYYDYQYLDEKNSLVLSYNACAETMELSFADFNKYMFNYIEDKDVKKIIVDLRCNSGGNSEILQPFTDKLTEYTANHPDVEVYILVGRNTFSSGMFAIYQIMDAVPNAVSIGEPTGGALDRYGEVRSFNLPNSQIPVNYSTKYFEFSKMFKYKNAGTNTFIPDVEIIPTISDYIIKNDTVLNYALNN